MTSQNGLEQDSIQVPSQDPTPQPPQTNESFQATQPVQPIQPIQPTQPIQPVSFTPTIPQAQPVAPTPVSTPNLNVIPPQNPPVGYQNQNSINNSAGSKFVDKKPTNPVANLIGIIIIILLLVGGAVAFAYIQKIGPFAFAAYTEENFSSGLLAKISEMDSATYTFSGSLNVVPRESDATPFVLKVSNEKELKQKYYYDAERMTDAQNIVSRLNSYAGYSAYSRNNSQSITKPYPQNLETIFASLRGSGANRTADPETGVKYSYQVTENGKNFNLNVKFSTSEAIEAVKGYGYTATSSIVKGKNVTFTKNSSLYSRLNSEPPKPFLEKMGRMLSMVPPELNAKIAVSASSELKPQQMANWAFNLDAQGDLGDMTYKVNADVLRKDENYYFKINNMPSFFLFDMFATMKGKWVMVPIKTASSTDSSKRSYGGISPASLQNQISSSENKYKENRDEFVKFSKKLVEIADEQKIILFKNKPISEKIDGRQLVRYDISIRKDKVLSFYEQVQSEIENNPEFSDYSDVIDQGYIDYLKSEQFDQVFDYFDKNNDFTIWVDSKGFPAIVQNVMRVVPPDEATQLEDKQINITFKLDVSNINKSIEIETPKDAVSIDEIANGSKGGALSEARLKGKAAALKANLSNIRAQAELAFDSENYSYGKVPFKLGACKNTPNTLFANKSIYDALNSATDNNISIAKCVSTGVEGKVNSWAISAPIPGDDGFSYCVDSAGSASRIINELKGTLCNSATR